MRIGTRSSTMAIAQTTEVARLLSDTDPSISPDIVRHKPRGDVDQVSRLDRHGGKGGAFVSDIRATMLGGQLECIMHSLKDMPGNEETPGLVIAAYLTRDPVEDVLVVRDGLDVEKVIETKAAGLKIGTNAVRRAAYLKRLYPEAEIIHYRGAADTRIEKLDAGAMQKLPDGGEVGPADLLVCARSGLARIGRPDRIAYTFSPDEILPAIGQGIVAVECLADDWKTRERLSAIDDQESRVCAEAEREVLWVLNGHCNSPIAGYAYLEQSTLHLKACVMSLDGATMLEASASGGADEPRTLGRTIALQLLSQGAEDLIDATRIE